MAWTESQYWDRNISDVLATATDQDLSKLEKELAKVTEKTKAVTSYEDLLSRVKTGLLDLENLKDAITTIKKDRDTDKSTKAAAALKVEALNHPQFIEYGKEVGDLYRRTKKLTNRKYAVKINVPFILDVETLCPLKKPSDISLEEKFDFDKLVEVKKVELHIDKTQLKYTIPVNDFIIKNMTPTVNDLAVDDQELFALFPDLKTTLNGIIDETKAVEEKYQNIPVDYEYGWQDIDDSAK